jgi:hypothetical protein
MIGLLQPLLALLLLAGVPLPGGAPVADARVAAVETLARGLAAQRDRVGGVEIASPDDPAGGDDRASAPPSLAFTPLILAAPASRRADPPPGPAPARSHRACAGPPRGPPFA